MICVSLELKYQLRDYLLLLFKRPFMKFVFEPHKNLRKASNHLKEEIRVDTDFMLKTHSQTAMLRWEV